MAPLFKQVPPRRISARLAQPCSGRVEGGRRVSEKEEGREGERKGDIEIEIDRFRDRDR
ncbi:hypothetical protein J6590_007420 [Homalodisca vitripennis]|nr:hypothetical protein J6590_007420 [Homalodisca vitripennis]